MRSRSNREDGSSHISDPGKDAAVNESNLKLNAKITGSMTRYVPFVLVCFNVAVKRAAARSETRQLRGSQLVAEGPSQRR